LTDLPVDLPITGPTAPPRSNGEMVFDAPWESRLFGVTMALVEADRFSWTEFQRRLIAAVGRWEADHPDGEGYRYYERWAEALESLLDDRGIVAIETTDARAHALAARPAGHDHHDHDDQGGHGSGPTTHDVP
jgi:nitrile hydratase accessory protein